MGEPKGMGDGADSSDGLFAITRLDWRIVGGRCFRRCELSLGERLHGARPASAPLSNKQYAPPRVQLDNGRFAGAVALARFGDLRWRWFDPLNQKYIFLAITGNCGRCLGNGNGIRSIVVFYQPNVWIQIRNQFTYTFQVGNVKKERLIRLGLI